MISLTRAPCAEAGAESVARPPARAAVAASGRISFVMSNDILSSPYSGRIQGEVPSKSSDSLRQADRQPACGTDRRGQHGIAESLASAGLARGVAVFELLGAEFGDVGGKLRVFAA